MRKLKSGKSLDARQRMLLDDAAYACVPPLSMAARAKVRPPLQAYMRHLVLERLRADDPKKVGRSRSSPCPHASASHQAPTAHRTT